MWGEAGQINRPHQPLQQGKGPDSPPPLETHSSLPISRGRLQCPPSQKFILNPGPSRPWASSRVCLTNCPGKRGCHNEANKPPLQMYHLRGEGDKG